MNTVKVKGMKPIIDKLKLIQVFNAQKAIVPIGAKGMVMLKDRTDAGVMVTGGKFPDYSPQYALVRQKAGLSLTTGRLSFTGEMMRELESTSTIDGVELSFGTSEANSIASIQNKKTPFFGFKDNERVELMQDIRNIFTTYMRGK